MERRLELEGILRSIPEVCNHVYHQTPEGFKMEYPCIRYDLEGDRTLDADNRIYDRRKRYTIIVMDWDPESTVAEQVGELLQKRMSRHYVSDNLHHFVYNLTW